MASTSCSSGSQNWKNDVFLSFRGVDTRRTFVSHLYYALKEKGIHTFKDDGSLERGKSISPELIKAILQSRFAIVVFSKNYASSTWCLDELVKIMECKNVLGQTVIPIFYDVDPSEVTKQGGSFAESFYSHEIRFKDDLNKVLCWRDALRQAGYLAGYDLRYSFDGYESNCIQQVVEGIVSKIRQVNSTIENDFVGMESRVHEKCEGQVDCNICKVFSSQKSSSFSGCPFGQGCHFLHYVLGGLKAVTQMLGSNPALLAASRNSIAPPSFPDGSSPPAIKTRLCSKYNTAEGCKFGDKCRFAHGDWELGRPAAPLHGRYGSQPETNPAGLGAASSFGSSATAKISVDASLAGRIIGKGGVNSKHIYRVTGAKFSIRDHEDPNLRNIELEGTIDQIEQAIRMARELIQSVTTSAAPLMKNTSFSTSSNYKTKICENFAKSSCTFGDKCHFAHGEEELRRSGL